MPELPLDPDEVIWTPEGQEYYEQRARRAYKLREELIDETDD